MTPTTIAKTISLPCKIWNAGIIAIDNLCSIPWEMAKFHNTELEHLNTLMTALTTQLSDDHDCPCELPVTLEANEVRVFRKITTWCESELQNIMSNMDMRPSTKMMRAYEKAKLRSRLSENIAQLQQLSLRLAAYENAYDSN